MKNTGFEILLGRRIPREVQLRRLRAVMEGELTSLQKETLIEYHLEEKTLQQIAQRRGVNRSTVWRTLKRAEEKVRRVMQY